MRDKSEFLKWLWSERENDVLNFMLEAAVEWMSFEDARPWLKPEATSNDWPKTKPWSRRSVLSTMRSYMDFAWGKALGHRGISAERSVEKFKVWLHMLGEEGILEGVHYPNYGAPILMAISEHFGFAIPEGTEARNMAEGRKCRRDCEEGCDR